MTIVLTLTSLLGTFPIKHSWQPRDLTPQLKQFPLIFVNNSVDLLSKSLTSFGNQHRYRVVYMGPRYASNMKAFKSYCKNDKF